MNVVFAPDSFKGSIDAADAAAALAAGWASVRPRDEAVLRPMADGGEGTLDALLHAGGEVRRLQVRGAAGTLREAEAAQYESFKASILGSPMIEAAFAAFPGAELPETEIKSLLEKRRHTA